MAEHRIEHPPYANVPHGDTLGLRHVRVMLQDIPWPTTTERLRARVGAWRVPITGAHFHEMRELLDGVRDRSFQRPDDVVAAIARAHPEVRES